MLSPRSGHSASSRSGAGSRQSNVSVNSANVPLKKVCYEKYNLINKGNLYDKDNWNRS